MKRITLAAVLIAIAQSPAPGGRFRREVRHERKMGRIEIRPEIRLARAKAGYPGLQVLANTTAIAANVTGFPWLIPVRLAFPVARFLAEKKISK